MDKNIDSQGKATVFSTLEYDSGYWQVRIEDAGRERIVFTLQHALYCFILMPFGLQIASFSFQRTMDVIRSSVKRKFALFYPNSIVIISKTHEQHIDIVCSVLLLLYNAGATLMLKKCNFFHQYNQLPRPLHFSQTFRVASQTTNTIRLLKRSISFTKLRSLPGYYDVFRRFVPNFTQITSSLRQIMKKTTPNTLHCLTAKIFKPWIQLRTLRCHLLCCHFHFLVDA